MPPVEKGMLADVCAQLDGAWGTNEYHSFFLPIQSNFDALQWRLALIEAAEECIDAQYFIWGSDEAGRLVLDRILAAADRGVRVRLLVDDLMLADADRELEALNAHPNFEVRLYNPLKQKNSGIGRSLEFLVRMRSLNQRMHNKLFVVDGRVAIVGGRNIGNPYFGMSKRYNFRDLDMLTAGAVVPEISASFDDYWNSELAVDGHIGSVDAKKVIKMRRKLEEKVKRDLSKTPLFEHALKSTSYTELIYSLPNIVSAGEARFFADHPYKNGNDLPKLNQQLEMEKDKALHNILIINPYILPGRDFIDLVRYECDRGVRVSIVTGTMAANNHTSTYGYYCKYRTKFLRACAEVYEYRHEPDEEQRVLTDAPGYESHYVCLHTKLLMLDESIVCVGSLNLDPRALRINTENTLIIKSPELAQQMMPDVQAMLSPHNAWRLTLSDDGSLSWNNSEKKRRGTESRHPWQWVEVFIARLLPIGNQL